LTDNENASFKAALVLEDFKCQNTVYNVIENDFIKGNAIHAYLIYGQTGMGAKVLAALAAKALLCTGDRAPCDQCGACYRCNHRSHLDLVYLEPEKGRKIIGVEPVRELKKRVYRHPFEGKKNIVIIEKAENLSPEAQNALLHVLEEPPSDTVFFLIAEKTTDLLTTIVSRCRMLRLNDWDELSICRILQRCGVNDFTAIKVSQTARGNIGEAFKTAAGDVNDSVSEAVQRFFLSEMSLKSAYQLLPVFRDTKEQADLVLSQTEDILRNLLIFKANVPKLHGQFTFSDKWVALAAMLSYDAFYRLFHTVHKTRICLESYISWNIVSERFVLTIQKELGSCQG